MADNIAFEWVGRALESATPLDRLEARGTLRLVLKTSGFDARSVNSKQLQTVVLRLLPAALDARGVADSSLICEKLARELADQGFEDAAGSSDSPENIFARLAES